MTDSNQTSQPAGSDRQEVLKVHPNMETFCIYNHVCGVFARPDDEIPIGVGLTEPAAMFDARSRLPNAPTPPLAHLFPAFTGEEELLTRANKAIEQSEPQTREEAVQATISALTLETPPAPQASIALHPSLTPEMPEGFAPEPVEQEVRQELNLVPIIPNNIIELGWPQPVELPPLDQASIDEQLVWLRPQDRIALECRERQLFAALRENQQLRQQLEASRHAGEVLMHTSNANFNRFKVAEQQLAQIKECKSERPEVYPDAELGSYCVPEQVYPLLDQQDAKIAALKLDNAQKAKRIAELEGGK
jgi:hypothetical protein